MEITIYLDVFFISNFTVDFFLLHLAALILRHKAKQMRFVSAALCGSFYALAAFLFPTALLGLMPIRIVAGSLMVLLAFRPGSFRVFLQEVCVFFAFTLLYGGAAFSFFTFNDAASQLGSVYKNGFFYINLPPWFLLTATPLCFLLLKTAHRCGTKLATRSRGITPLWVTYNGKTMHLSALYDSGNLLREKTCGCGVIVAEWQSAKHLFPHRKTAEETKEDGLIPIPFRTLQGESMLYAFFPDAVYTNRQKTHKITEAVCIALADQTLDHYHNWDAILPHDFKGEYRYETKHLTKTADKCHTAKA